MVRRSTRTWMPLAMLAMLLIGGCESAQDFWKTDRTRWLDPSKPIKAPARSPISPILPNVGLVDQSQEMVANATFPQEGDWTVTQEEYVLGPTDIVNIFILDLYQEGAEAPLQREISAAGFIDLPLLGERIQAVGLTLQELRERIEQAYAPGILRDPQVTVVLAAGRQNVVSMLGAVARPGQYPLVRRDTRLLDMLAIAGDVIQPDIRYIYVIRPERSLAVPMAPAVAGPAEAAPAPAQAEEPAPLPAPAQPQAEPVAPQPQAAPQPSGPTQEEIDRALRELEGALPERTAPSPAVVQLAELATGLPAGPIAQAGGGSWRYEDGHWVRDEAQPAPQVQTAPAQVSEESAALPELTPEQAVQEDLASADEQIRAQRAQRGEDPFGWRQADRSNMARVIAIDLRQLKAGQPRMNIVIRNNDIIQVPYLETGEFYIGGEVLRPGVYSLTGRQITIKQALAAAGNLGPLAWPENSLLVRRIDDYQEQYIPLDIEAIFRNESPDVQLKANDQIWVGTEIRAIFYAVMRNAFRMTYGFGFIYDRNFSDPLFVTPRSNRFTRL